MIDGHAVSKETIVSFLWSCGIFRSADCLSCMQACGAWEAVKTITSDPAMLKKLQNTKRQRKKFDHEDVCCFLLFSCRLVC